MQVVDDSFKLQFFGSAGTKICSNCERKSWTTLLNKDDHKTSNCHESNYVHKRFENLAAKLTGAKSVSSLGWLLPRAQIRSNEVKCSKASLTYPWESFFRSSCRRQDAEKVKTSPTVQEVPSITRVSISVTACRSHVLLSSSCISLSCVHLRRPVSKTYMGRQTSRTKFTRLNR